MAKIKLTQAAVDKVKAPDPSGKQTLFWDSELKGFAVLASGVTNSKSYIVQRDICGGRQRRMTVGDARTIALKEARDLAASMLHDLRHGIDPKRRKAQEPTLRATLNEFLESRQKLRPASVVSYRWGIQKYCAPWLDRPLREITGDMVEARHRAIAAEVAKDRKPKGKQSDGQAKSAFSGESTANSAMRTFRILWNFAADRAADRGIDPLPSNPVRRLNKQWFEEKRREGIVREEDMSRFYHAILALKNPVHSAYLRLLLFTGLRRTEAATLKWEDIDLHKKVIRIPANRTKAGRALALPMSDYVFDLLNEW